jgi:hypothetical protein
LVVIDLEVISIYISPKSSLFSTARISCPYGFTGHRIAYTKRYFIVFLTRKGCELSSCASGSPSRGSWEGVEALYVIEDVVLCGQEMVTTRYQSDC